MPPKKAAAKPAAATKPAIQDPTKVRKSTSTTEKPKKAAATKAEKTSATKAPTVNGTLKKRPATAMAAASEQADEVMADAEAAPEAEKPKKGKAAATKKAAATGTAKTNGEAPKKAPAAKAARSKTPTPAPEPAPTKTGKRKLPTPAVEEETAAKDERAPAERPTKRAKTAATAAAAKKPVAAKTVKAAKVINEVPTQVLDVYVFGEGSSGELGLGSHRVNGKKPIDVKRPRLNENLSPARTGGGVVQIATGGMHAAVLTKDNRILTWGVNDQGALGRDTSWEGGLRDIDASEDSDAEDEDTGLNPRESTPAAVDPACFPEGTRFVQLAASDNATFALTDTGLVWGWGTFRVSLDFDTSQQDAGLTAISGQRRCPRLH